MSRKPRSNLMLMLLLLVLLSQACRVSQRPVTEAAPSSTQIAAAQPETPTPLPSTLPSLILSPRPVPSRTPVPTLAPPAVNVTAVGGDLAIRAGPDTSFDAIAVLPAGQGVPVYARSIEDGWLEVPIPSQRGKTGWISTRTGYSQVDGYVLDLPMITRVEWPFGAYLRNCTPHQIVAEPGDTVLPPVSAAPANRVWFYPGLYTLYDADAAGRPEVMQVKLFEHTDLSLLKDGTGVKWACP